MRIVCVRINKNYEGYYKVFGKTKKGLKICLDIEKCIELCSVSPCNAYT